MAETVVCSRLLVNYVCIPHMCILKADFQCKSDGNRMCHWKPCRISVNSHILIRIVVY